MTAQGGTCRQWQAAGGGVGHARRVGDRTKLTLRLSADARNGWDTACEDAGVTLTALVEAIGLELHRTRGSALGDRGADIVIAARRIDQARRNRR